MSKYLPCRIMSVPDHEKEAAARLACSLNPANAPRVNELAMLGVDVDKPGFMGVLATKFFGPTGVHLTVGFAEPTAAALQERILSHMNAWSQYGNVSFTIFQGAWQGADVRISRGQANGGGYWSYLGTDVLHIPKSQVTMNLEGFVMATEEAEFHRVVRHETGHTLGAPHEHSRREIVAKLDPAKTVAYFHATQGWSELEIHQQILTPIEESTFVGATPHAEVDSIMCYAFPGSITVDGNPIPGGIDITPSDGMVVATLYPKAVTPPPVVLPPVDPPPPVQPPPVVPPITNPPITLPGVSLVDLMTFFGNVTKLIADYKAKNYSAVATDALALIQAILNGVQGAPAHALMSHSVVQKDTFYAAALMSTDEIVAKIEEATGSPDAGSLAVNVLLPLLVSLVQKLILGF